jgi:ribosome recycling factor
MQEELNFIFDTAKEHMDKAIHHLEKELLKVRAGRANPSMLEGVRVDYYGSMTPISQVANINTPDARTLSVQPWEKKLISEIEKAIMAANLGFNPMNNGDVIMINIPPLTEERRKDLVRRSKSEAEDARVGVRNARKEAMEEIKKLGKDGLSEDLVKDSEAEVQKLTDSYTSRIESIVDKKEQEIMAI